MPVEPARLTQVGRGRLMLAGPGRLMRAVRGHPMLVGPGPLTQAGPGPLTRTGLGHLMPVGPGRMMQGAVGRGRRTRMVARAVVMVCRCRRLLVIPKGGVVLREWRAVDSVRSSRGALLSSRRGGE